MKKKNGGNFKLKFYHFCFLFRDFTPNYSFVQGPKKPKKKNGWKTNENQFFFFFFFPLSHSHCTTMRMSIDQFLDVIKWQMIM